MREGNSRGPEIVGGKAEAKILAQQGIINILPGEINRRGRGRGIRSAR